MDDRLVDAVLVKAPGEVRRAEELRRVGVVVAEQDLDRRAVGTGVDVEPHLAELAVEDLDRAILLA